MAIIEIVANSSNARAPHPDAVSREIAQNSLPALDERLFAKRRPKQAGRNATAETEEEEHASPPEHGTGFLITVSVPSFVASRSGRDGLS